MREIRAEEIRSAVKALFVEANKILPQELEERIRFCAACESSRIGKQVFDDICENMDAARELDLPICQDTGMAVIFAEIGQDVHILGGFEKAVNDGVHDAYLDGGLRCSVVGDPLRRVNTGDNTPAIIHIALKEGDGLKLTAAPKGFGSENMSRMKMFTPSASKEDIVAFVKETAALAGGNPCPPEVIGVGIGSDFEGCALLAKKALCRPVDEPNPDPFYRELEDRMLQAVNETGVGPQGFGGDFTALKVNIEQGPTHIAGLPVAVNVGCHVTRHKSIQL